MGLAVGISGHPVLHRLGDRRAAATSPARIRSAAGGQGGGAGGGDLPPSDVSFVAAFVCDAPARGWLRHPNNPGVAWASGCEHDDDLHARAQSGWPRGAESARSAGAWSRSGMSPISVAASREYCAIEFWISRRGTHRRLAGSNDSHCSSAPVEEPDLRRYTATATGDAELSSS